MLKCIYDLVQAPHQSYMLCREVDQKAGMEQLETDECIFIHYVSNIIGQPLLTTEDLLVNGKSLNMKIGPMQMRVYRSCSDLVAAMILVINVDNGSHYQAKVALARFWPTTNTGYQVKILKSQLDINNE